MQRFAVPSCVLGRLYFTEAFKAGRTQSVPAFRVNTIFTMSNAETYCHYYTAHPLMPRLGKVKSVVNCPSMRIEGCRRPSTEPPANVVEPHPRDSLMPTKMIENRLIVAVPSKGGLMMEAACVRLVLGQVTRRKGWIKKTMHGK